MTTVRHCGTLADGGVFETVYLLLFTVIDGRTTHMELFELEDLPRAVGRLAELRPDPPR